jgi:ribosomal protein L40E
VNRLKRFLRFVGAMFGQRSLGLFLLPSFSLALLHGETLNFPTILFGLWLIYLSLEDKRRNPYKNVILRMESLNVWYCRECGTENPLTLQSCRRCGHVADWEHWDGMTVDSFRYRLFRLRKKLSCRVFNQP